MKKLVVIAMTLLATSVFAAPVSPDTIQAIDANKQSNTNANSTDQLQSGTQDNGASSNSAADENNGDDSTN